MNAVLLTPEELEQLVARAVERAVAQVGRATSDSMTTAQAAELAGVTPKTVRAWVEAGALPACHRGRRLVIHRADLEAHLAGDRPKAGVLLASLAGK